MNYFMVNITLPEIDDELFALLHQQKLFVENLMCKELITSYSLAGDRSAIWIVFKGEELNHVRGLLSCFPIINKVSYEIFPLASYQDATNKIRSFSLN